MMCITGATAIDLFTLAAILRHGWHWRVTRACSLGDIVHPAEHGH